MDLGKLRHANPDVAAQHLHGLLESELLERFLFQVVGAVSAEEINSVTSRALQVFMAAYGPQPVGASSQEK